MKAREATKEQEDAILDRYYYTEGELRYRYSFNKCEKGRVVGTLCHRGYRRFSVLNRKFLVHRVVWFLHHGDWPSNIDHIDQDKNNNRIENLRPCTMSENKRNVSYNEDAGVRELKNDKWEAYAHVGGEYKYLGVHCSKPEAKAFRDNYLSSVFGDFHVG